MWMALAAVGLSRALLGCPFVASWAVGKLRTARSTACLRTELEQGTAEIEGLYAPQPIRPPRERPAPEAELEVREKRLARAFAELVGQKPNWNR